MMQLKAILLSLFMVSVAAFQPAARRWAPTSVRMAAEPSRRNFIATGMASLVSVPMAANAAKYGGFGAGSPEVLSPDVAALDLEVLKSSDVQEALKATKYYLDVVKEMESQFEANPQIDLAPAIIKYFDFSKMRSNMNVINGALDEDVQRGTDRLIRAVIQDITELDVAGRQKPGVPRSERKIAIIKGKLEKIDAAFSDFLKFFDA